MIKTTALAFAVAMLMGVFGSTAYAQMADDTNTTDPNNPTVQNENQNTTDMNDTNDTNNNNGGEQGVGGSGTMPNGLPSTGMGGMSR
jgi:hypothetical protein